MYFGHFMVVVKLRPKLRKEVVSFLSFLGVVSGIKDRSGISFEKENQYRSIWGNNFKMLVIEQTLR